MVLENKFMYKLTQLWHEVGRLIEKKDFEGSGEPKIECFGFLEADVLTHSTKSC